MNRQAGLLAAVVAVALGIGGGYWWGTRTQSAGPVQVASDAVNPSPTNAKAERKILYYRNPMGLPDTSPVPKKDPMGMDYVAVYDGDEPDTGNNQIKISVDKVQKLGVRSEPASMRSLDKVVKAVGRIEVDASTLALIVGLIYLSVLAVTIPPALRAARLPAVEALRLED